MSFRRKIFKWKDYILLFVLLVISFLMILFTNSPDKNVGIYNLTRDVLGNVFLPVSEMKGLFEIKEENEKLRVQNNSLKRQLELLEEAKQENARLRQLLSFAENVDYNYAAAKVIRESDVYGIKTVILNIGNDNGIKTNFPVVCAEGLVGRIIQCSANTSVVQLLNDVNFRSLARIQESRVAGLFKWTLQNRGELYGIHKRHQVREGFKVITSGLNSLYPAGLEIGTIIKVTIDRNSLFQNIIVEPSVDFNSLEEVFVLITGENP